MRALLVSAAKVPSVYCIRSMSHPLAALGGTLQEHPSLQDRAYAMLRQGILDGVLPAGSRLIESEIAQALGVSRNPVRESIRRLQQERLVVVRPRIGVFVAGLSLKEIVNTYTVRGALEGLAASLAAHNLPDEGLRELRTLVQTHRAALSAGDLVHTRQCIDRFHELIQQGADNERLLDVIAGLVDAIARFRAITSNLPERRQEILRDHEEILNALEERDANRAEWAMRLHVDGSRRRLLAHLRDVNEPAATPQAASPSGQVLRLVGAGRQKRNNEQEGDD